jgi:hypothetical protein
VITARRVSVATLTLALAACGKPLGTYEVRDVKVVPVAPLRTIDPEIDADPEMLRIEFTSKTDLYEAVGGDALYVFASFCPFQDKSPIYVSEPYYNDQRRYDPVTQRGQRPTKKTGTGEYVYTTYLRLSGKESVNRGDGRLDFTAYDFRKQQPDICLRIEHPGYYVLPSRSQVFVLPAAMIRRALSS